MSTATGTGLVKAPPPSETGIILRRCRIASILAVLLVGVVATIQLSQLRTDLASAPGLVGQYARLGTIHQSLLTAGTAATTAVLTGKDDGSTDAALAQAAGDIVVAAQQNPGDSTGLAQVNALVLRYGQQLHAAITSKDRATATTALASADILLDRDLSKARTGLQQQIRQQATTQSWAGTPVLTPLLALVCIAGVAWAGYLTARRTYRVVNLGVAAAVIAVAVMLACSVSAIWMANAASVDSRQTRLDEAASLCEFGVQFGLAQRAQTQTVLLQQGSSMAEYTDAMTVAGRAAASLDDPLLHTRLTGFEQANKAFAAAVAAPDWTTAGRLLLSTDKGSLAVTGKQVTTRAAAALTEQVASAQSAPREAGDRLLGPIVLIVVMTAAAVAALGWGLGQRVKEYR